MNFSQRLKKMGKSKKCCVKKKKYCYKVKNDCAKWDDLLNDDCCDNGIDLTLIQTSCSSDSSCCDSSSCNSTPEDCCDKGYKGKKVCKWNKYSDSGSGCCEKKYNGKYSDSSSDCSDKCKKLTEVSYSGSCYSCGSSSDSCKCKKSSKSHSKSCSSTKSSSNSCDCKKSKKHSKKSSSSCGCDYKKSGKYCSDSCSYKKSSKETLCDSHKHQVYYKEEVKKSYKVEYKDNAFYINGKHRPKLNLKRGRSYTFEVESKLEHKFYFSKSESWNGQTYGHPAPVASGTVVLHVDAYTPPYFYYGSTGAHGCGSLVNVTSY